MISKSDYTKPLGALTTQEAQRVSKLRSQEAAEELDVLGQESDTKAARWIREKANESEKQQRKQREIALDMLLSLRKNKRGYIRFLSRIFLLFAKEEDIPKKYHLAMDLTNEGLVITIKKTKYYGAFAPCGIPPYDYHACKLLAVKLGNTIAKLEGYHRSTDGGVLLPYEDERKVYGGN